MMEHFRNSHLSPSCCNTLSDSSCSSPFNLSRHQCLKMAKMANTAMNGKGSKFLNSFWDLASDDSRARCLATKRIIVHVNEMQKKSSDHGLCSDGEYAIQRLIRGLSSSRDSARQGFSACLCQFLVSFPVVEVTDVTKMINDNTRVWHCIQSSILIVYTSYMPYNLSSLLTICRYHPPCAARKRGISCSVDSLDT